MQRAVIVEWNRAFIMLKMIMTIMTSVTRKSFIAALGLQTFYTLQA